MKDTAFYDTASATYSARRYPQTATTFTHFFFKQRLQKVLALLAPVVTRGKQRVLELGCADGIAAAAVSAQFKGAITAFDALDLSSQMIAVAQARYAQLPIHFAVRGAALTGPYDVIIEVGVLNYTDLERELATVAGALAPGGRYICSIGGTSSLQNQLKGADGYQHLASYAAYEAAFAKYFRIEKVVGVGIFVPYLWKIPAFARLFQPLVELVALVSPSLALEKVYVLASHS